MLSIPDEDLLRPIGSRWCFEVGREKIPRLLRRSNRSDGDVLEDEVVACAKRASQCPTLSDELAAYGPSSRDDLEAVRALLVRYRENGCGLKRPVSFPPAPLYGSFEHNMLMASGLLLEYGVVSLRRGESVGRSAVPVVRLAEMRRPPGGGPTGRERSRPPPTVAAAPTGACSGQRFSVSGERAERRRSCAGNDIAGAVEAFHSAAKPSPPPTHYRRHCLQLLAVLRQTLLFRLIAL